MLRVKYNRQNPRAVISGLFANSSCEQPSVTTSIAKVGIHWTSCMTLGETNSRDSRAPDAGLTSLSIRQKIEAIIEMS